jgi:hypothetical protein
MVLRARFKKKLRLYVQLKIYDKNRRKITGPQCVKKHAAFVMCPIKYNSPSQFSIK